MPETTSGREAILKYLDDNKIATRSLARTFGVSRQYLEDVLNGKRINKGANELILKIIDSLKI